MKTLLVYNRTSVGQSASVVVSLTSRVSDCGLVKAQGAQWVVWLLLGIHAVPFLAPVVLSLVNSVTQDRRPKEVADVGVDRAKYNPARRYYFVEPKLQNQMRLSYNNIMM